MVCGWGYSLILTDANLLYSCGDNEYGQLGIYF